MKVSEFKVVFGFKSLNEVINESKQHWSKYAAVKKKLNKNIAIQCPKLSIDYPIDIVFEWFPKDKRKDPDNIAFNKKYILDAMTDIGTIMVDTQKVIKSFKDEFVYGSKEDYVIIKIYKNESLTPKLSL